MNINKINFIELTSEEQILINGGTASEDGLYWGRKAGALAFKYGPAILIALILRK